MKRFIDDAIKETNTSIVEYGTDKLYKDAKKIYLQIWRLITNVHEDYFWNYWFTDLQEGANEYELQRERITDTTVTPNVTIPGIDKVKKVYIKQGDTYVEIPQLADIEENCGIKGWMIKDNHIILSWTPEEDIDDGLKLEGTISPNTPDFSTDVDTDLFPGYADLQSYDTVLGLGLKEILRRAKQDFDKANLAKADFSEAKEEMKRYITERVQRIYYSKLTY